MASAILERTPGFELSSETIAPRYLKIVTVPRFCPLPLIDLWMPLTWFAFLYSFAPSSSYSFCIRRQKYSKAAAASRIYIVYFGNVKNRTDEESTQNIFF